MSELIRIIWDFLNSDDSPALFNEYGDPLTEAENLEAAQQIAEAIIAAGWPRGNE